ncbi:ribonuclease H-like domain-containing protein [Tanacetum coccineum]
MTHPHPNRRFVPQAVLTRSGKINTAGANVNTAVRPVNTVGSKPTVNHPRSISNAYKKGYSQVTRPFNKYSEYKNSILNKKVNTVRVKDTTARDRAVLLDESSCYVRVPRKDNIYSVDLKSVVPTKGLTCLFAKATIDESNLWHRRLGHINFKNMNKLIQSRKFDGGKALRRDFFVRYSVVSKAMRVFNKRARIVEETLNNRFLENTPNVTGNGLDWIFDVDSLTISMNYVPVVAGNQTNCIAGTRDNIVTGQAEKKTEPKQEYILIPICTILIINLSDPITIHPNSTNSINTVSSPVSAAKPSFTNDDTSSPVNVTEASNAFEEHLFERFSPFKNAFTLLPVSNVTPMDDTRIFGNAYDDEDVGAEADSKN